MSGADLTQAEAARLLSFLTADDGVCLVGGQSIGLWAMALDADGSALEELRPFSTSDIDYLGDLQAARIFARKTGGRLFRPSADTMNSNSSALVEVTLGERTVVIDFLHAIIGVDRKEIERGVIEVGISDGQGGMLNVPVIAPFLCLKSRIANMISAATRRRDTISFNQARASVILLGLWIDRLIDDGEHRQATRCISELIDYCDRDQHGKKALLELDIDPLSAATRFVDDNRLNGTWRERTLLPLIEKVMQRRAHYAARRRSIS